MFQPTQLLLHRNRDTLITSLITEQYELHAHRLICRHCSKMIWNGHSFASHLLLRINLRQSQDACEMHSLQQGVFICSSFEKVCFMDIVTPKSLTGVLVLKVVST
jgi:hypothetical protein